MLPLLHNCITSGNLRHANRDECEQSNLWIIRLDEDYRSGCSTAQVLLNGRLSMRVGVLITVEIGEPRFAVVGPFDKVALFDCSSDRGVSTVIGKSRQKCLVDRSTHKLLGVIVERQHVDDRVWLPLEPEAIAPMSIVSDFVDFRLASVDHDVVVIRIGDGPYLLFEVSCEEIVP